MLANPGQRKKEWLLALALMALTCLAYLPVLHAVFVWDDSFMVVDNPMLRSKEGLHDLLFTSKPADPYRITMASFWLQWHLWGSNPLGYHVVNVIMHGLGAILLWRVLLRLGKEPLPGAWLAAAVFALHPVCAASAAWVSEQKNTWSIIFFLLTILWYLRFETRRTKTAYVVALFMYGCAIMSKGSVVMLPVVLLLIVWWRNNRITAKDLLRTAPYFLMSLGAAIMTVWFQDHKAIAGDSVQSLNMLGRIAAAGWVPWFYLWKGWVPVNLAVIYRQWHVDPHSVTAWLPLVLICATFFVCWRYRAGWGRHALLGFGCFVAILFPVMGFFNMYFLVFSRVADHWQYLALTGSVALAVCSGVYWFGRAAKKLHLPKITGPTISSILLLILAILTWTRAEAYTNEQTLWSDTVEKNPTAWMAFNNLGNALGNEGKTDESIVAYSKAIEINHDFPDAHSNLGNALVAKGQLDEAIIHLKKAIAVEPRLANFHFNYGIALAGKHQLAEAVDEYNIALQLSPGRADVRNNLANVLNAEGKYKEALEQAMIGIQINPNLPEPYLNAATALSSLGQTNEAAQYFESTLKMRPNLSTAHYDYGMMLAMHGNLEKALGQFQEVVRLKPDNAAGHSSLGNTLAGLKRLDEAIAEFREVLRLKPDDAQGYNNLATALLEQGKTDQAIENYRLAIKLNGDDAGTRINFAYALGLKGSRAEAITQYQEALRLKPGDATIQRRLQELSATK